MIYVIATVHVRPDKHAEFLDSARAVILPSLQENGCRSYDILGSITEPAAFTVVERWESRDAVTAHFETVHVQEWRRQCEGVVVDRRVEVIDAETIERL